MIININFQYSVTASLNHDSIGEHTERMSKTSMIGKI